ncbi:uncharacterized protein LOC128880376 isoform X1 [Hylaeus volcanicus]|uniref:uncharacterized protein LOC128880376 isoform X1 n=1 Tax=Hylaeus volcanicus TaxID=313075 RepID=UPI0023B79A4F|nr:uncharacterized protein LOC128880376 isoform X1 [Hylaeus volcanicus]
MRLTSLLSVIIAKTWTNVRPILYLYSDANMSELNLLEILKMFDVYLALLENSTLGKDIDTENVVKAFQCAQFIESTIAKAYEIGKENILENHLRNHWLEENRSHVYTFSELKTACDKLLETYLKDATVSTNVIDEFLKLYVQYYGSERLNNFLRCIVINGVCTNIVIESLGNLGISESDMQDEALIMSWDLSIGNGNRHEVLECICEMFDDGLHSKIVRLAVNSHDKSKVKQLIVKLLSNKLVDNDVNVCLALANVDKKSLWKLIQSDSEFYTNFLDAVFYFARHMKRVENDWTSDCEFEYEHLLRIVKTLVNGPAGISDVIRNRVQLVKMLPNGTIWHKIEKDIG